MHLASLVEKQKSAKNAPKQVAQNLKSNFDRLMQFCTIFGCWRGNENIAFLEEKFQK